LVPSIRLLEILLRQIPHVAPDPDVAVFIPILFSPGERVVVFDFGLYFQGPSCLL